MKKFPHNIFNSLQMAASSNARKRMNFNLHDALDEDVQVFLNCIQPQSYIPPHRHTLDSRDEYLIALQGRLALFEFSDSGSIISCLIMEPTKESQQSVWAAKLDPDTWHSVISLSSDSILLELKAGPFRVEYAKELAKWAPKEYSSEAVKFTKCLEQYAQRKAEFG